jgi:uncharacterized protein
MPSDITANRDPGRIDRIRRYAGRLSTMRASLPIRRFDTPLSLDIPRLWLPNDPATASVLDTYTVLVPSNEAFYMRTLSRCLPRIEDTSLRVQGAAFILQEAEHGVAHKRYWRNLDQQGYRYRGFERWVDRWIFRATERIAPLPLLMSMVSCVEHINAYIAHEFLSKRILAEAHPEVRALLEWHLAEEIEHKTVAFDVLNALWPSYWVRLAGWMMSAPLFYGLLTLNMLRFLGQNGQLLRTSTWRRFWHHIGPGQRMFVCTLQHLFDYLRPAFHPSQLDDRALADEVIARYSSAEYAWLSPSQRCNPISESISESIKRVA